MNRLLRVLVAAALPAILVGCSGDGPTTVASGWPEYTLRRTYSLYPPDREPIMLETRKDLLAIRFREGITADQKAAFAARWNIQLAWTDSYFGLTLACTEDAFVITPRLWHEGQQIEYVGPVFGSGTCGGDLNVQVPANEILLQGNLSNDQVVSALAEAHATLVSQGRDHALYRIPWTDAGTVFDLMVSLTSMPAVEFAEPNFLFIAPPIPIPTSAMPAPSGSPGSLELR